nr:PREDICTED: uncharacterized protein LOC103374318 [Stegastes partitus]
MPSSRLYKLSRPEKEAMEEYINESLAAGLIRPSSSPLGASFFFVEKKGSSLCPCIDYGGLNDITVKDCTPLPFIDPSFEPLCHARVFSKLDLRNTYHLIRIREGDEWKTAFNTPLGHFEYLVMPFGLTNAPAVFQSLMNNIFPDMINHFVFIYLDDILIFSQNTDKHRQHVRLVLQRLLENRLYVKPEKCEFHASSVSFQGYVIAQGQLRPDPAKIEAVANWPTPGNRKELQRFLGFANFYQRFIRDYSKAAVPLTSLTSTKTSFCWSSEADNAFETLKSLFTSAPVLKHPDPSLQFVVEVDASDTGMGAVLSQRESAPLSLRCQLPGAVKRPDSPVKKSALVLIDSGADDSFIDQEFATQIRAPLELLDTPKIIKALDGRLLATVTHRTRPLSMIISGNRRETIQKYVITSPLSPAVLGLPWLRRHNPHLNWITSTVTSWSISWHAHCLKSAAPERSPAAHSAPPPNLISVPPEYHDLATVFSKDLARALPPHRPYDCANNLLPGVPLPSSRLYKLSRPEKEDMEEYINESLVAGLIRPSSSPLGAGFFFVEKKDSSLRPCIDYGGLNDITVLIDSGADDNFIDQEFATQIRAPLELLDTPKIINALDGRLLATVTDRTRPLSMIISGNHRETIQMMYAPPQDSEAVDPIIPESRFVGAATWEIESVVREVQKESPDPRGGPPDRLFVPPSARSQVLQWGHSSKLTCHPEVNRTLLFLRQWFWWPDMS